MRIGVDASCWGNKRGFGRFTRELLTAVFENDTKNEYLLFSDTHTAGLADPPENVQMVLASTSSSQIEAASSTGRRSLADLWAMSRAVLKHKIDLFFFPAVYSYFPIFNRSKVVVTIHDVIADHHPNLIFPNGRLKLFWKLKQNLAVFQSDIVLTVSDFSKVQIQDYFRLPESRLRVIGEGARPIFREFENSEIVVSLHQCGLGEDDRFLLYVGGISPHKNLGSLVTAFQKVRNRASRDIKLVLVGDYKDDPFFSAYPDLKKQVEELEIADSVVFTGFVEDLVLAHLYNAASLLVFPSLEEGFGLPAVEAMSCATPVAASNRSSLPEVLADAGCYFDPEDTDDIADVILEILDNNGLRADMKRKSRERAKDFQWDNAALKTIEVFSDTLNR